MPTPGDADKRRRDPLGPLGERAAATMLRRKGYRVLGRNLRVPMGEADLLCRAPDRRSIVLVEVKSRRVDGDPGDVLPEHSITAEKRRKLTAILRYLAKANAWGALPLRVDVVAVEYPRAARAKPTLRHHQGVIVLGTGS